MNHLAIYNTRAYGEDYIDFMLRGIKTVDSKFTYRKTAPFGRISHGDIVYLKESSGPVRGRIQIGSVRNHEFTTPDDIMSFLGPVAKELGIRDDEHLLEVWKQHANKRYVCQWTMHSPEMLPHPVKIYKHDRRIWIADYAPPEELLNAFK